MNFLRRLLGGKQREDKGAQAVPSHGMGEGERTVAVVVREFMIKNEDEFAKLGGKGLEALDLIRSIVNSGFSKESIWRALQHRDGRIRSLMEEFLRQFAK